MAISAAPLADPADPRWLAALAAAGIEALQIREKALDDRGVVELARRARSRGFAPGLVLVNGRIDLALAAEADGVHLPADEVPVAALRERFGPAVLIGRSTHRVSEVEAALREGADYVTFGPVWPSASKPGHPGVGPGALRDAAAVGLPVLALGGVDEERLAQAADAGAHGVAAIRMFAAVDRLAAVADSLRTHFGKSVAG